MLATSLAAGLAVLLVAVAWFLSRMPWEDAYHARTEEGIIEELTLVFYGLALLLCIAIAIVKRWKKGFYGAIVFLAFALRELDFHNRFTPENIDSTRYWRSVDVPLLQKLFVAILIAGLVYALVMFLKGGFRTIREDLRNRRAYAVTVVGIVVFMAASMVIDKQLDTDIIDKATEITGWVRWILFLSLAEETIEMGIPILACLALVQWAGMRENRRSAHPE